MWYGSKQQCLTVDSDWPRPEYCGKHIEVVDFDNLSTSIHWFRQWHIVKSNNKSLPVVMLNCHCKIDMLHELGVAKYLATFPLFNR